MGAAGTYVVRAAIARAFDDFHMINELCVAVVTNPGDQIPSDSTSLKQVIGDQGAVSVPPSVTVPTHHLHKILQA